MFFPAGAAYLESPAISSIKIERSFTYRSVEFSPQPVTIKSFHVSVASAE